MNLKKLVKMARDKNPNQHLAKLSIQWAKQNGQGNPVRNAVKLWYWQLFVRIDFPLFILLIMTKVFFKLNVFSGEYLSVWTWAFIFTTGPMFVAFMSNCERGTFPTFEDVKHFISGITLLEGVVGKQLDQWAENDKPELKAVRHLKALASAVKTFELIEKGECERVPWKTPSRDKQAAPKREVFGLNFGLLTDLLPLKKDKKIYYGDNLPTLEDAKVADE